MPEIYKKIRVFIASPNDVEEERRAVAGVVQSLNRSIAGPRGLVLELLGWEIVVPDMGSPQSVINSQLPEYEVFIGVMWKRFGTPTQNFGSGTEEEFNRAYQAWTRTHFLPRIMFYFCERPIPLPCAVDDVEQLRKVIEFKDHVRLLGLSATYCDLDKFSLLIQEHLLRIVMEWPVAPAETDDEGVEIPARDAEYSNNFNALNAKLKGLKWVGYDPSEFDPDIGLYPSEESLKKDFHALSTGPFNGIITFGSGNTLGSIPRLAKECGIQGVIMGIYSPRNSDEIAAALRAQQHVDGYCVGHGGLNRLYDIEELREAMNMLRERTKRPVSTSQGFSDYKTNPELMKLVDWLFPDMHYYWHEGAKPEDAFNDLMSRINIFQDWIKIFTYRKVALKMISYPSSGGPGLSENAQARFFALLLRRIKHDTNIADYINCTFFAAFDNTWKTPEKGWSQAELSTGFYSIERQAKLSLEVIKNPWRKIDESS